MTKDTDISCVKDASTATVAEASINPGCERNGKLNGESSEMVTVPLRYLLLLEERLKALEAKVEVNQQAPVEPSVDINDLPAPYISRIAPDQWRVVKRNPGIVPDAGTLLVSSRPSLGSMGHDSSGKPHRLAINSRILLSFLTKVTGEPLTESRNVWVRPFKYLVLYEEQIRRVLANVDKYWETEQNAKERDENDLVLLEEDSASEILIKAGKRGLSELRCLIQFMDIDMHDIFDIRNKIRNQNLRTIAFEFLWLLYKPGDLIFSACGKRNRDRLQAYKVLHVTGGRSSFDPARLKHDRSDRRDWDSSSETEQKIKELTSSAARMTPLIIDCVYTDCDGYRLGPKSKRIAIPVYMDERPILSLEVYPAYFSPDYAYLAQRLTDRGRLFLTAVGGSHKRYSGMTLRESQGKKGSYSWEYFEINAQNIDSEVMIDQAAAISHFMQQRERWRFNFGGGILAAPTAADGGEVFDAYPEKGRNGEWNTDVANDAMVDVDRRSEFLNTTDLLEFRDVDPANMSEDYLKVLTPRVYGYAMRNRKWFPMKVDLLTDVDQTFTSSNLARTRFEDLVLPRGHKKLLQALVRYHTSSGVSNSSFHDRAKLPMDVVQGKGEGLIILLHGPPGVGKTSTAECVAAQLQRPLLPITCGDLGYAPSEMEKSLDTFCHLAEKWRCVLLLDEADVFLSKREKGDIEQNTQVAMFLRVLEYYSGVLILTSNRVGEFDEAFRSRIHICLFYPKLDKSSTNKIWEKNIARVKSSGADISVEEEEIRHFYELLWKENEKNPTRHWNGRQIKNAFQTSIALAHWDFQECAENDRPSRPILSVKHFKRVGQTSAHFDDYIGNIYGIDAQDVYSVLAAREEFRKDTVPNLPFMSSKDRKTIPRTRKIKGPRRNSHFESTDTSDSDDEDSEEEKTEEGDDIEKLKLKLEIARLKEKYAKGLRKG